MRVAWAALVSVGCSRTPGEVGGIPVDDGPVYVIATAVFGPDATTTYVAPVPSLEAGVEPDYARSIAVDSFASIHGVNGEPTFYVGSGESPELTEWTLDGDRIVRGRTLSFGAYGLARAGDYPDYVAFAAPDKAYLLDTAEMRLLVWDPLEMVALGEIPLGVAPHDGLTPFAGEGMVLRDDGRLLIGVYFWDVDTQKGGDLVQLVEVDTATDTVLGVHTDDRCGDNYSVSRASDGTTYFSGGPWGQVLEDQLGPEYGASPCQLRVVPPSGAWDASYSVDLRALTGGRPTGEFVLLDDDTAFLRVFHAEVAGPFDGDAVAYGNTPAYSWWRWALDEDAATLVPGQQPGVSGGLRYRIDGRTYVTVSSADYSTTTLAELSVERGVADGITVLGYPYGVLRLR